MAKTLEAHDKLIREIFGGDYEFEIPNYQRPYAWTTEQAGELFDDLVAAMQDACRSPADTSRQYFLGSIVLIKKDRDPQASVVDGQQRLSTLTLLFAVLREVMPDAADDITDFLYKKGKASLGEKNKYRLIAREEDADFFCTYIQETGGIKKLVANSDVLKDSRLRYRENAELLLEKAKGLSPKDLGALWQFLANDCSLVVISTPDLEAAYRIFSVLNNRGLDLAPIDILKAQVLGVLHKTKDQKESNDYAKKWSRIENDLGREAFGELFSHIRSIYAKQKQRGTLIKEFQEYVKEYKTPDTLIDKVIEPYAEVWDFIRNASFESTKHEDEINEHLSWLNRVDFKDWAPPALLYCKRFRKNPELIKNFLKKLERLTYFLWITRVDIFKRIEIYSGLTREIELENFDGTVEKLETLELSNRQRENFVSALDGDIYTDFLRARMALVLRLESWLRQPGGVKLQDPVSLEHVLPQTPKAGSQWLEWFPDQDEREAWTHRLANLVPLDRKKNSSAGNFDFAKKKDVYFKGSGTASPFVLTQEVRAETEWTPALLAKRQEQLLGLFKKHWDLKVRTVTI
jgi:hypothetical protein